jgi:UTP:GlnB (protein PII) uridylyltransferase
MGDGTVRDSFEVASTRPNADADTIRQCIAGILARVSEGALDMERALRDRCPARCSRDDVSVELDLDSAITTGVRLRAPDRPGLLHDAALTISMNGFRVRSITVLTVGGVARDTFRIVDGDGRAPTGDARLRILVAELTERCR